MSQEYSKASNFANVTAVRNVGNQGLSGINFERESVRLMLAELKFLPDLVGVRQFEERVHEVLVDIVGCPNPICFQAYKGINSALAQRDRGQSLYVDILRKIHADISDLDLKLCPHIILSRAIDNHITRAEVVYANLVERCQRTGFDPADLIS